MSQSMTVQACIAFGSYSSFFLPFVDLKGGTFVTNNGGLYVSGSVGLRVATNEKQALNFSV